jgi:hypothetical protein
MLIRSKFLRERGQKLRIRWQHIDAARAQPLDQLLRMNALQVQGAE